MRRNSLRGRGEEIIRALTNVRALVRWMRAVCITLLRGGGRRARFVKGRKMC